VVKPGGMATEKRQRRRSVRGLRGVKIESVKRVGIGTKERERAKRENMVIQRDVLFDDV
jgi:hypothetical protein